MKKRIHKIKSHFGLSDFFKFFSKQNDYKIDKNTYNKIITDFNEEIRELIINDNLIYSLPHLGFEVVLKKDKRKPRIVNGKLINNIPVDWKATNELWNKNPESKKKKLLVRYRNSHTSGYIFRIYFKKFKCNLKNRSLYKFQPNRKFKRQLSARIKDPNKDNLDAFLLY